MTPFWSPPFLLAGPCALEGGDVDVTIAEQLAGIGRRLGAQVVFKGSFDKANRANALAPRGLGLEAGLAALRRVHEEAGLPVMTDVHETVQIAEVASVVHALQIPAFLCRQTDLLEAAGATGLPINVKKGQWMAAEAMSGAVDKLRRHAHPEIVITERGTFFGYGDLVVDMRNFARLGEATGCPVAFDATHSVQQPGQGPGGASGADRSSIPALLLAAAGAGADGFFVETHPYPARAPSDGPSMVPLAELEPLLERALEVWSAAGGYRSTCV